MKGKIDDVCRNACKYLGVIIYVPGKRTSAPTQMREKNIISYIFCLIILSTFQKSQCFPPFWEKFFAFR